MEFDPSTAKFETADKSEFDPSTAVLEHDNSLSPEERDKFADGISTVLGASSGIPSPIVKLMLTKGGKVGDISANVLFSLGGAVGGGLLGGPVGAAAGGAAGAAVGDTVSQSREMFRGERQNFSTGELAASAATGAIVPGPIKAAGTIAETVGRTVLTRGAQGAGLGAAHEGIKQFIDDGKLDLGQIAHSGAWGAGFGAALGSLEGIAPAIWQRIRKQPPKAAAAEIAALPEGDKTKELIALQKNIEEHLASGKPNAAAAIEDTVGIEPPKSAAEQSADVLVPPAERSAETLLPAPVAKTADEIHAMTGDDFLAHYTGPNKGNGLTADAYAAGDVATGNPEAIAQLKQRATEAGALSTKALREGDYDAAGNYAAKAQFFREGYERATNTGSARRSVAEGGPAPEGSLTSDQYATEFNRAKSEEAQNAIVDAQLAGAEQTQLEGSPASNQLNAIDTRRGDSARERARLESTVAGEKPIVDDGSLSKTVQLSAQAQRMHDQYGFISPLLMARMGSTGLGAAYGFATGKDPEDKVMRALQFGALGAVVSTVGPSAVKAAPGLIKEMYEKSQVIRRGLAGESAPAVSAASEQSGNSLVRFVYAPVAATLDAAYRAGQVLGSKAKDKEFATKLGAVLVEDRLRAIRQSFIESASFAADPAEAAAFRTRADKVQSVIGKGYSPIRDEGEFQALLKDPEIMAAIERHKEVVQPFAQEMHEKTGGDLARSGVNTDAFVNLRAVIGDEAAQSLVTGAPRQGDLTATMQRKSRFNREAAGTAEEYDLNYDALARRMIESNYTEAAKRDLQSQFVADGIGQVLPLGERPQNPENWMRVPYESRGRGEIPMDFWVRKDVAKETLQAFNTRGSLTSEGASRLSKALNTVQLAGPTDAIFHSANIVSAIAASPKGKQVLAELAVRSPGVNVADALIRLADSRAKIVASSPEIQAKLVNLAKIGAMRPGSEGFVHALDQAGRLAMDGIFDDLVSSGLKVDTEAARREFVNQLGQYSPRLMGQVERIAKEMGLAPFIVAGKNFNRLGVRAITGTTPGAAPSATAEIQGIATNLASLAVSALAVPAAINYLTTGKIEGRPGTSQGMIDLGVDDENGKHWEIDPLKWTNARRGLRVTGINSVIDGLREDKGADRIGGEAVRDIIWGAAHPWLGPAPTAGYTLLTGQSPSGFQEAKQLNPQSKFPTVSQGMENAKAAGKELVPLYGMAANEHSKGPVDAIVSGFGSAVGIRKVTDFPDVRGRAEQAVEADMRGRIDTGQEAQKAYEKISKMQPGERRAPLAEIAKTNPLLFDKVIKEFEYQMKGLTPTERSIARLGVEDGARAEFLARELKGMSSDNRREFIVGLEKKDPAILSEKVLEQLAAQMAAGRN